MRGPSVLFVLACAACGARAVPTPAPPGYLRVFKSSVTHDGNLGGAAGGDALCNDAATAAGIAGRFDAFLGTAASAAPDRLQGAGPWYLVDGSRMIFSDKAALIANGPSAPIRIELTEQATPAPSGVWTGWALMSQGGCNDWSSASVELAGSVGSTSGMAGWSDGGGAPTCYLPNAIYCFER